MLSIFKETGQNAQRHFKATVLKINSLALF